MVVVGHRGLRGFTRLLVGSVGVQTAAHAACPVIVVRGNDPEDGPPAGEVVVGVDCSELSSLAVDFASNHAALHHLGVLAVQAYPFPAFITSSDPLSAAYDIDDLREDHARFLAEALAGHRDNYPDVPLRQKGRLRSAGCGPRRRIGRRRADRRRLPRPRRIRRPVARLHQPERPAPRDRPDHDRPPALAFRTQS